MDSVIHCLYNNIYYTLFYIDMSRYFSDFYKDLFIFLAADKFIGSCIYYFNVFDKFTVSSPMWIRISAPLSVTNMIPCLLSMIFATVPSAGA